MGAFPRLPSRRLAPLRFLTLVALAAGLFACEDEPGGPDPAAPLPIVRSLAPDRVTPGQAVEVSGANFGADAGAVQVLFGELEGDVLSVASDRIVAVVPRFAPLGRTPVRIRVGETTLAAGTIHVVAAGPPFTSVGPGGGFTCATRQDAGAFCWGAGTRGTLGTGEQPSFRPLPQRVAGGGSFTVVGSGSAHACALDSGGAAWCWGRNDVGQLGNGILGDSPQPVPVAGGLRFVRLSVGFAHACGLTAGGEALCWGGNESAQLGDGTREDRRVPTPAGGGLRFERISAGDTHTCALTSGGLAWCWGANRQGELGTGDRADATLPAAVMGGRAFVEITAGSAPPVNLSEVGDHTCATDAGGQAFCWGYNGEGQLGTGGFASRDAPAAVATEERFAHLSAGAFYTCGVTLEGRALCWGQNDSGQLGTAATNRALPVPVTVVGELRLRTVTAGKSSKTVLVGARPHTCGLAEDGAAFCWGSNASGQLGDGQTGERSLPVPVVGGE